MRRVTRTSTVVIRVDDELRKDLRALAEEEARALNNYVYLILKRHVQEIKAARDKTKAA